MANILLLDDDADFAAALARSLTQEGHGISVAGSVREALDQLRSRTGVDLVIADLHLCRESGIDLVAEMSRWPSGAPVILLSASPDASSYLDALRLGAYEYLSKPLDLTELRHVLRRALSPLGRTA